jgi:hypothetical protein
VSVYQRLEQERPKRLADHTALWEKLKPLASVNGDVGTQVQLFCERKQLTPQALGALEPRLRFRPSGAIELAFAGRNKDGRVTAIKYRPLTGSSHDSRAEVPSTWLLPIVLGKRDSLDWLVAEGETDAARLFDLVGSDAAIMVLPSGADTFKREWTDIIPRGARVALCYDADDAGDKGAERAARILGGQTVRIRPPDGFKDWCEWDGDREAFLKLASGEHGPRFEFEPMSDFLKRPFVRAEALLGEPGMVILARGSLFMVYGADGSGKSTFTIDGVAHLAAGVDWLGIPVPRPVRVCLIENEGPPSLYQQKLAAKAESWDGPDWRGNVFVFAGPWGEFSFASSEARRALVAFCEEREIDVVVANPTLGLGVAASGRPDETQAFVDWLVECGLKSERAFWLLHHENKSGQISGDWGRHPDTKIQLQQDGNDQRTKLDFAKTRWATLPSGSIPKVCLLEWVTETQGYTVVEIETQGASDSVLKSRLVEFLREQPMSSTRKVYAGVQGSNERLRELLKEDDFDSVSGPNRSTLWLLASGVSDMAGTVDVNSERNPHE